eukprot:COSAG01_NODE_25171_length_753_cov_1.255352_1_plen_46_part_10
MQDVRTRNRQTVEKRIVSDGVALAAIQLANYTLLVIHCTSRAICQI